MIDASTAALVAFAVSTLLWVSTRINAGYIGLVAVLGLVLVGALPQERLFDALGSDIVWLMIGAFIVAAALREVGLATRFASALVRRCATVSGAFWALTTAIVPLAMVVPSTSGRAALLVPLYLSLSAELADRRISRALALLIPTVILVSTVMSLIGAGSHLIAVDLLVRSGGPTISFADWARFGVPLGLLASYSACWVVLRLFLTPAERTRPLVWAAGEVAPLTARAWLVLGVVAALLLGWFTHALHGLDVATVTVIGAAALCAPKVGVISWTDGLKAVSWNLVVFVGVALVLGRALIDADLAGDAIDAALAWCQLTPASAPVVVVGVLAGLGLAAHLIMPSHAARATAFTPPLLVVAARLELDAAAVVLISSAAIDYCLTFPVSSKALLVYQELDGETFHPADLLRLSAVLLPIHLLLIVALYLGYWQWVGFAL